MRQIASFLFSLSTENNLMDFKISNLHPFALFHILTNEYWCFFAHSSVEWWTLRITSHPNHTWVALDLQFNIVSCSKYQSILIVHSHTVIFRFQFEGCFVCNGSNQCFPSLFDRIVWVESRLCMHRYFHSIFQHSDNQVVWLFVDLIVEFGSLHERKFEDEHCSLERILMESFYFVGQEIGFLYA